MNLLHITDAFHLVKTDIAMATVRLTSGYSLHINKQQTEYAALAITIGLQWKTWERGCSISYYFLHWDMRHRP